MRPSLLRLFLAVLVPAATAACSGGGGGGGGGPGPVVPPGASSDADLASLETSQGRLHPEFSPDLTFYFAGPAFFDAATLTATPAHPGATMTFGATDPLFAIDPDLQPGEPSSPFVGVAQVEVTAEDGVTTKTYTVVLERGAPPGLQTYVKASNTGPNDDFGQAVAASGDTVVVGARFEASASTGVGGDPANDAALFSGAAYVFVSVDGVWTQQAYLKASNTEADDRFGTSVAISGDTIVVGAPFEDGSATGVGGSEGNGAPASGAAYVFVRTGTTWSQQAYVKASNTEAGDRFAASVAISGDTVVVGAPGEDGDGAGIDADEASNAAPDGGAAYVFRRTGTAWAQEAYVKPSNAEAGDEFGSSVTVSVDQVAIGAPGEDSDATGVNGNQASNAAVESGAVYVFTRTDGLWAERAYLKASNAAAGDQFGLAVSIRSFPIQFDEFLLSFDVLAVGAPFEDSDGDPSNDLAPDSGAAYVFQASPFQSAFDWDEKAYLKASNVEAGDQFGAAVSAGLGVVAVGAPLEGSDAGGIDGPQGNNDALASGAVYVFFEDGLTTWAQASYVKASNTRAGDEFGRALALSDGVLAVGAHREDGDAVGIDGNQAGSGAVNSGAVYLID